MSSIAIGDGYHVERFVEKPNFQVHVITLVLVNIYGIVACFF